MLYNHLSCSLSKVKTNRGWTPQAAQLRFLWDAPLGDGHTAAAGAAPHGAHHAAHREAPWSERA